MSSIPQKYSNEKNLIDCVQRFFPNTISANYLPDVMERRKKAFPPFLCSSTNSITFLLEEVCICNNVQVLLRRHFPRILFIVSSILQKQIYKNKLASFYFFSCY